MIWRNPFMFKKNLKKLLGNKHPYLLENISYYITDTWIS